MATLEQLHAALIKADAAGNADDAKQLADAIRAMQASTQEAPRTPENGVLETVGAGLGSGFGKTVLGGQHYIGKGLQALGADSVGKWLVDDAAQGRAKLNAEVAPYKQANPMTTGAAEFGGEMVPTMLVGGGVGAGLKAMGAKGLGTAVATAGASGGGLGTRGAGGAVNGLISSSMVEPGSGTTGAVVGGAFPILSKGAGYIANAAGALVKPFTTKGQNAIVGDTLRRYSDNPQNALASLLNAREIIPGSAPTTAMAAGDSGLASLQRGMVNADPQFASALAARQTQQNAARTAALDGLAGSAGKIDIAKAARDAATGPMREEVLNAAGKVPAAGVIGQIDRMLADPNNAGKLSQSALSEFKDRIAKFTQDGAIDARALYAIRKDINDVLGGKLQGEAGNMRYAASQLSGVKGLIDDAIDKASRTASAGVLPSAKNGAKSSWSGYLQKYASDSLPINQMEELGGIMRSIQTGTSDDAGNLVLSAAKLNNILKNQGAELTKKLSAPQMEVLRNLAVDLNAQQIVNNTGRAVGSNTMQNLAQNQLLTTLLGNKIGASSGATSTLGRVAQLPYGIANNQIAERMRNALLDPAIAAQSMTPAQRNKLAEMLMPGLSRIGYQSAPVISAQ